MLGLILSCNFHQSHIRIQVHLDKLTIQNWKHAHLRSTGKITRELTAHLSPIYLLTVITGGRSLWLIAIQSGGLVGVASRLACCHAPLLSKPPIVLAPDCLAYSIHLWWVVIKRRTFLLVCIMFTLSCLLLFVFIIPLIIGGKLSLEHVPSVPVSTIYLRIKNTVSTSY